MSSEMKVSMSRKVLTVAGIHLHDAKSFLRNRKLASFIIEAVYLSPFSAEVDYLQLPAERCQVITEHYFLSQ